MCDRECMQHVTVIEQILLYMQRITVDRHRYMKVTHWKHEECLGRKQWQVS